MIDCKTRSFKQVTLEQFAKIISDKFTGPQITRLFEKSGQPEIRHNGTTKWIFMYDAFKEMQEQGNVQGILKFLEAACDPIEHALSSEGNVEIVQNLNTILQFHSLKIDKNGEITNDKPKIVANHKYDSSKLLTVTNVQPKTKENNLGFMIRKPLSVFVSHSNKDNMIVEKIESAINKSYIELFLAHRDIEGGEQWREIIRDKITKCDMMLALITSNFHASEYTEQEVGAAWVLQKPVLAIRVDETFPRGFITEKQWITYSHVHPYVSVSKIIKSILSEIYEHDEMVNLVVEMLIKAESYIESNSLAAFLESEKSLTSGQIADVKKALKTNSQVYDARITTMKLRSLLENNQHKPQ